MHTDRDLAAGPIAQRTAALAGDADRHPAVLGNDVSSTAQASGPSRGTSPLGDPSAHRHRSSVDRFTLLQVLLVAVRQPRGHDLEGLARPVTGATEIKENLALMKRETGVTDAEIVKIPAMYEGGFAGFPGRRPAPAQDRPVGAYHPRAVNGVVLTPTTYLAPKQWRPVIGGKDILAEAVTRAYAKAGMRVRYLDDWRTHHVGGGEVHCGTNTIRAAGTPW